MAHMVSKRLEISLYSLTPQKKSASTKIWALKVRIAYEKYVCENELHHEKTIFGFSNQ